MLFRSRGSSPGFVTSNSPALAWWTATSLFRTDAGLAGVIGQNTVAFEAEINVIDSSGANDANNGVDVDNADAGVTLACHNLNV